MQPSQRGEQHRPRRVIDVITEGPVPAALDDLYGDDEGRLVLAIREYEGEALTLNPRIDVKERPLTRRGILAALVRGGPA